MPKGLPWFRLYAEFAHDPKVQSMPEEMQRRLIIIYCLQCSGCLCDLSDDELALALRIDRHSLSQTKELFLQKKFILENWKIRQWSKRQMQSDYSAERMRRHREKMKRHGDVTVTPSDTDTDTDIDTDTKKKKKSVPRGTFHPPSLDELKAFIQEKGYSVNPEKWMAHYEANGWMVGRNKMKSWKATVTKWHLGDYGQPKRRPEIRANDTPPAKAPLEELIRNKENLLAQYQGRTEPRLVNAAKAIERELAELRQQVGR
jgi:hypothetical protein